MAHPAVSAADLDDVLPRLRRCRDRVVQRTDRADRMLRHAERRRDLHGSPSFEDCDMLT
jgi:hypothetical protein